MFDVRLFHLSHVTVELKSSSFKTLFKLQFDVKSRLIDLLRFCPANALPLLNVLFELF